MSPENDGDNHASRTVPSDGSAVTTPPSAARQDVAGAVERPPLETSSADESAILDFTDEMMVEEPPDRPPALPAPTLAQRNPAGLPFARSPAGALSPGEGDRLADGTELSLDDLDVTIDEGEAVSEAKSATSRRSTRPPLPPTLPAPALLSKSNAAWRGPSAAPATAPAADEDIDLVPGGPAIGPSIEEALRAFADDGWVDRLASITRELEHEKEASRRAVLEYEAGLLHTGPGADDDEAIAAFERAMALDAAFKPNLWSLRALYEKRGQWEKVASQLEVELSTASTATDWAELLVDKAHLFRDRLGDETTAEQALRTALIANPSSLPALMALERIAIRRGDAEELARVLRLTIGETKEPARKSELLLELARRRAGTHSADEVCAIYLEALAVGVAPDMVIDDLEAYSSALGDRDPMGAALARAELARFLELRIQSIETNPRPAGITHAIHLRRRLAQLLWNAEPARARSELETALGRSANDPLLVPLLLEDLSELAEIEGRWSDLAELLAHRAAATGASGTPSSTTARLIYAQARALRRAGLHEAATRVTADLATIPAVGLALLADRQSEALDRGDLASLATLFRDEGARAEAEGEAAWAAHAWAAAAAAHRRMGEKQAAVSDARAALAVDPGNLAALDALDRLLDELGWHAERAEILVAKLAATDATGREAILEALVALRQQHLGDVDGAIEAAQELGRLRGGADGDDASARALLVEITRSSRRWEPLSHHLEALAQTLWRAGSPDRAIELRLERAEVAETRLGDAGAARAILEAAVRDRPEHAGASKELRRVMARLGDWSGVAASLRAEIAASVDAPAPPATFVALAEAESHLSDAAPIEAAWQSLAGRAPTPAQAASLRIEQLEGDGQGRLLAEALAIPVEAESRADASARLLRLAELEEDAPADRDRAAATYLRAAALTDDGTAHAALGLFRNEARGAGLGGLDAGLAALGNFAEGPLAAVLSIERARRALATGNVEVALQHTDEAQRASSEFLPAKLLRHRIAVRQFGAAHRSATLASLAEATSDPRLRAVWFGRAAVAAATEHEGARASLLAAADAVSLDAPDAAALSLILDPLRDDPAPNREQLDAARAEQRPGLRLELIDRLVTRGALDEAAALVNGGLAAAPGDLSLLFEAARIARLVGDRRSEARANAAIAVRFPHRADAMDLLEEAAQHLADLGEKPEAAAAFRAVFRAIPSDVAAFARARDLYAAIGDEGALEELLTERLPHAENAADRAALLRARGDVRARTARPRAASQDFRAALALAVDDTELTAHLGDHLAAAGDVSGALKCFESLVARHAPGDLRALDLHVTLSQLHERSLDLREAAMDMRRALILVPDDAAGNERLANLLEQLGDSTGALEALRAAARVLGGPRRARIELRAAALFRRELRDPQGARVALGRALAAEPLNLEALRDLMVLCESPDQAQVRRGALDQAAQAAKQAVAVDASRRDGYAMLARVRDWQGDEDGAQLAHQAAALVAGRAIPPRRAVPEPSRPIPLDLWRRAVADQRSGLAFEVWQITDQAAARVLGPDPVELGAGRSTRQSERLMAEEWPAVDQLARALGVGDFALHAVPRRDACVVCYDQLLLGEDYRTALGPAQRFTLARRLVLLRDRLGPMESVTDEDLDLYYAACAHTVGVSWRGGTHPSKERVQERARLISQILDRRARKSLLDLAPSFALMDDVSLLRGRILDASARLALATAGDLGGALEAARIDPHGAHALGLAQYVVSEEVAAIRSAMGMRV